MSDDPQPLIAIRKTPRVLRAGLEEKNPEEKRSHIVQEADSAPRPGNRAERLRRLGLSQLDSSADIDQLEERLQSGFVRLPYIGAYVVAPQTSSQADDAAAILADDYLILKDDLPLRLPPTTGTGMRSQKRFRKGTNWPEWTGIREAHAKGITGGGVRVMVLDTGCDADHTEFYRKRIQFQFIDPQNPRLRRNVRGFDPHGHGTHVSGIIAGQKVGVAPDADLFVASVIESESTSTSFRRILAALDWLMAEVANVDTGSAVILNMSLGFTPQHLADGDTQILLEAMRAALQILVEDFEVLPVVASGNDGERNLRAPGYFPEVLSVGAATETQVMAEFTSRGVHEIDQNNRRVPDVWGIGVDVYSSLERNRDNASVYAVKSGTSMAAPFVAGVAALCAQQTGTQGKALRDCVMERLLDGAFVRFVP